MAQCIPSSITEVDFDLTRGEKLVFDLLKRLPNDCMVWYEVVLHERSRKPDFIVLDPNRGICILEVKDWSVDAILEASRREFRIKWKDNPTASRQNPDQKCKIYLADAKELLSLCDELVDDRNRLVVPVDYLTLPQFGGQQKCPLD